MTCAILAGSNPPKILETNNLPAKYSIRGSYLVAIRMSKIQCVKNMMAGPRNAVKRIPESSGKFFNTGDTGLHRGGSNRLPFSGFHVLAQDGVDRGLVAPAVLAEKREHVGINAQGNLLLRPRPENCVLEEVRAEFGRVGKI